MADLSDEELLDALGVETETPVTASRTPREERIIAGFEDIERFYEQNGRIPQHGEGKDIFERIYAVRLDRIRESEECLQVLAGLDRFGLLQGSASIPHSAMDTLDDSALLAELGVTEASSDLTTLTHVKPRAEIRAAEDVAQRTPCEDFETFRPLFLAVQEELKSGIRISREFKNDAQIRQGEFFILGGQKVYVAEMGPEFINDYDRPDRRLRVIYDNGTESDILLRSLQRALHKDESSRRISDPAAGPLFSNVADEHDGDSGTVYVLQSASDDPFIRENRQVIHKIGVTGGDVTRRIAGANLDPTFLMADVEVVATYELANINRVKLENLIHRFFAPARLSVTISDRFGNPIEPKEWFLVPLFVIDEVVGKIRDGSIVHFRFDKDQQRLMPL